MENVIQRMRKGALAVLPITVTLVSIGFSAYVLEENKKLIDENEKLNNVLIEQYEVKTILEDNATLMQSEIREYKVDLNVLEEELKDKNSQIENLNDNVKSLEREVQDLEKKAEQQRISRSESPTTSVSGTSLGTFQASAYTAYCSGCSGKTATGINLRDNPNQKVIAVDPSIIPLGTKVWVEGYGVAVAGDTGGAIKGKKIDIFIPTKSKAYQWGVRNVEVKIIN